MTRDQLQKEIFKLLKTSTVPEHYKIMLENLVPIMDMKTLQATYDPLFLEQKKMRNLDQRKKRIEYKYRVMVEKLAKMELDK